MLERAAGWVAVRNPQGDCGGIDCRGKPAYRDRDPGNTWARISGHDPLQFGVTSLHIFL